MVSMTTQKLRARIGVGGGVAVTASARVAPQWCSTWRPSARQVMREEAQPTVRERCRVPDASVK